MRKIARRLLFLCFGLGLGLLLAEGIVRLLHLAPEVGVATYGRFRLSRNPRLGYEPVPNLAHSGSTRRGFDFNGRSNGLGFRDRDHPIEKPAGSYRIVVLGDSIAWGLKVADSDHIFPAALERILGQGGVPADVLNFGVSGYNTLQEVAMLVDRGLTLRPDLVLLSYCLNDRVDAAGGVMQGLLRRERNSGHGFAFRAAAPLLHSALYRAVRFHPRMAGWSSAPVATPDDEFYADFTVDTVEPSFRELRQLAATHHFQVLVAVFPSFVDLLDYKRAGEHEEVRALAEQNGFAFVDLLAPMQECERRTGRVWVDHTHPNDAGHLCAAEALAAAVLPLQRAAAGVSGAASVSKQP